jgi:hypothetical protein
VTKIRKDDWSRAVDQYFLSAGVASTPVESLWWERRAQRLLAERPAVHALASNCHGLKPPAAAALRRPGTIPLSRCICAWSARRCLLSTAPLRTPPQRRRRRPGPSQLAFSTARVKVLGSSLTQPRGSHGTLRVALATDLALLQRELLG